MSTSSFDPSKVVGYGTTGQDTARKMSEAAESHSLAITYDSDSKKFTVLNSANLGKEAVAAIFNEKKYEGWEPKVLNTTDSLGNRVVQLKSILNQTPDNEISANLAKLFSHDENLVDEALSPLDPKKTLNQGSSNTTNKVHTRCQEYFSSTPIVGRLSYQDHPSTKAKPTDAATNAKIDATMARIDVILGQGKTRGILPDQMEKKQDT